MNAQMNARLPDGPQAKNGRNVSKWAPKPG